MLIQTFISLDLISSIIKGGIQISSEIFELEFLLNPRGSVHKVPTTFPKTGGYTGKKEQHRAFKTRSCRRAEAVGHCTPMCGKWQGHALVLILWNRLMLRSGMLLRRGAAGCPATASGRCYRKEENTFRVLAPVSSYFSQ